ncbi:ABC transporter substrate-binding protein [Xanthobacter sp. KR7-65]|uniref:ABC transporter substrate-binding protein n=1 Tax=Xanthobacter sp. KR7-65 TaxID=3156612 RepID=UPI0032B4C72A
MIGLRCLQRALILAGGLATLPLAGAALAEDLKIALIAPVSGPMARQGDLMRKGAELAIEDINAAGGIKALGGAKLALVVEDAGDKVETAKNAAQRLVANRAGVVAGTGSWSSSLTLAVTEVTERAELPWLTLSYADQITDRGFKYVVQTVPVASQLALNSMPTVLDMAQAASGKRPTKVAIISDSTAASQAFVKPLREGGFEKLGVTVVADEVFTPPLTDATAMVQKLRATKPDFMLFYSTSFPDAKLVLTKMNEFGLGKGKLPAVTVGVQLASPEMLKAVGPELLEGLIVVAPNWPSKAQEAALPGLTKRSGEPWLGQDTISTYGDVWLVKDALERAGSADGAKVMAALRATNRADGPADYYLGDHVAFDDKGRRIGGAVGLVQWQGGMPYLIWPKEDAVRTPLWPKS